MLIETTDRGTPPANLAAGRTEFVWRRPTADGERAAGDSGLAPWTRADRSAWGLRPGVVNGSGLVWGLAEGYDVLRDVNILIVDDCTLDRENLAAVFEAQGTVAPLGAWDLPSLFTALEDATPNIVLLSIATRDSASLLQAALEISPNLRVIVLGVSEDDESEIVACAEAGVAGYHMRTESLDDLLVLIRKVAAGESLCSPRVSAILLRRLSVLAAQRQPVAKELVLTAREAQILRMLEMGRSNRAIAEQLCIAVHTVKNHVHSLLNKLGVNTRAEAAALSRTYADGDGPYRN